MLALTVRLIVSLAIVVGLLIVLARVGQKRFAGRAGSLVRVVHRQSLTRSSSVAVVTVGSRILVLGTTDQQVRLLTELDPEELGSEVVALAPGLPPLLEAPADPQDAREAEELLAGTYGDSYEEVANRMNAIVPQSQGRLAGSALSPQTWKQAFQAATSLGGRR